MHRSNEENWLLEWSNKHPYLLEYLGGYNVVLEVLTKADSSSKHYPHITKYGAIDFVLPKDKLPHTVGMDLRLARYSVVFKGCHDELMFTATRDAMWLY